jgi:superfamily II DNA/RNA helicase
VPDIDHTLSSAEQADPPADEFDELSVDDEFDESSADDATADESDESDESPAAPPAAAPEPSFAELGVSDEIVSALVAVGITHPFPIQAMTLPVALGGHDIIGQAKTGTGKTLGFGIPTLQRVIGPGEPGFGDLEAPGKPQALAVVPTRELAVQVAGDLDAAAKRRSARVLTVYGGRAYEPQIDALKRGVEIVVGTPGRLLDLAQQGHLVLGHARIVVLDEADEMLDLGFLPDVERLLAMTPAGRQTMLFSATMPGAVVTLARRYMTQPTHIRAADPDDTGRTVKAVKQFVYRAHALDKTEMLARILQAQGRGLTMIFARTKRTVAKVAEDLTDRGFAVGAIHGDLGQGAREQALRAFRNGKVDVLVATDVAARGIDVDDVTHVINYQCPEDEKTYLHRIGRTARAGNKGTAITFVDWDETTRWNLISTMLDLGMPDPVETYSSSPHLFGDLDIPEGTRGTLPRSSRTRAGLRAEVVEDLGETGSGRSKGRPARGRGDRPDRDRGSSRGSGRGRSDGDGDGAGPAEAPDGTAGSGAGEDAERRPRQPRQRRRTRGGMPVEGEGEGTGTGTGDATSADPAGAPVSPVGPQALFSDGDGDGGDQAAEGSAAHTAPRRRRRRRSGGRSGEATTSSGEGELTPAS